ncbi:MAG: helix-turn-helix domain-containing protein [Phycisphaerales bacterium]
MQHKRGTMIQQGDQDRLLKAADVARRLAISTRLVWRFRAEGKLPAVQIGGATRFRLSDVERFIREGMA